ncbi:restriction endonuclease subunit S [Lactococcus petauri]|uniref:restriction endonuclease subunit S n=1 Tax=Lactococcus petauri TaxID=1940789 RepID=UPI003853B9CF
MTNKHKKVPELRFKGFTDDWEQRKLGDVANFFDEKRVPIDSGKRISGKYPYYGATGIIDYVNDYIFDGEYVLLAEDGANITMRNSPVAYITTGKFWLNNHAHILKMIDGSNNFLIQILENQNYEKFNSGTAQPKLNGKVVKGLHFYFPSSQEQQIVGLFFKQLDDTITLHQRKLDLLKEQKKGFLQKMFPKNGDTVPELRFEGFADAWEQCQFKDVLKSHSFRQYLAEPHIEGEFEVIQQGNRPVVGYADGESFKEYADVTLFGDHTVSLYKPVKPFFLATDGVKILSADGFGGQYLFSTLERYKPEPQGYKRHFSILKNEGICFTKNTDEQLKIGSFFANFDHLLTLHQRKLDLLKEQKKGFLQKMFV